MKRFLFIMLLALGVTLSANAQSGWQPGLRYRTPGPAWKECGYYVNNVYYQNCRTAIWNVEYGTSWGYVWTYNGWAYEQFSGPHYYYYWAYTYY